MKFTHQLKFNAVPEWREEYVRYQILKKLIYKITTDEQQAGIGPSVDEEALQPLVETQIHEDEANFVKALDSELQRIVQFFNRKESELLSKLESIRIELNSAESSEFSRRASQEWSKDQRIQYWSAQAKDREKFRPILTELYVQLTGLRNYVELNREGFRKILKKHDKNTSVEHPLKERYMRIVDEQFSSRKGSAVQAVVDELLDSFAIMYCGGDVMAAKTHLDEHLREQLHFERNTVWRDMVGIERRKATARVTLTVQEKWWAYKDAIALCGALVLLFVLVNLDVPFKDDARQHCLALFGFVTVLWCTEALPLWVTSMLIPPLVVMLRVLVDPVTQQPLPAKDAAPAIFHAMFSQVIMLLLGGFAIAAALSKHFIAKQMAISILSRVGRKPRNVLLAIMLVATFASMWISNVAAPVLCFSIIQPILRTLPPRHPFSKALVMGIALASNIGGMTSPISSPQNIIAIEQMSHTGRAPTWLQWFAVALPVAVAADLLSWLVILMVYKPGRFIREVRPLKASNDPINTTQVYVVVISITTVVLWCCNSLLAEYIGEMGVMAVLPLVAFFGFHVLDKDDFNAFLWHVIMLAMGGMALGEAVRSSGLLKTVAMTISEQVAELQLWAVVAVFCGVVLVGTTFISHTVGALVILPILLEVGQSMPHPHPKLLVMAAALMCSGAMGLPVSGFPNMNAVALEDATGEPYVDTTDFLKVGVPNSVLTYLVIITVGYALMMGIGY